jgi:hypothetical protein
VSRKESIFGLPFLSSCIWINTIIRIPASPSGRVDLAGMRFEND